KHDGGTSYSARARWATTRQPVVDQRVTLPLEVVNPPPLVVGSPLSWHHLFQHLEPNIAEAAVPATPLPCPMLWVPARLPDVEGQVRLPVNQGVDNRVHGPRSPDAANPTP